MSSKEQWEKYLQEAKEIDEKQSGWNEKIKKGCNAKIVEITYHLVDGFAIDRYLLPFEQKRMKSDMKEWKKYDFFEKIETKDIEFKSFDQL